MYPNFYFLFEDLFGVEWSALVFVNTFGFFVAMGFLVANYFMAKELKRKEAQGLISARINKVKMGGPLSTVDLISNAVVGFLIGWKFIYLLVNANELFDDPQSHILSSEGSIVLGIITAIIAVLWKYYDVRKIAAKYPVATMVDQTTRPYQLMGGVTLVAAVAGFIGAKLFDHLEHWDQFVQNPLGAFLDPFSGLTFYGGLIMGGAAVLWYAQKNGVHWRHMLDVGGPAMMVAYAVGRIGCHMSGDGDWGIVNTAAKPGGFKWLPDWLWSYQYPNNVARICDPITGVRCQEGQDVILSMGVWPTPIFETIVCTILFVILWSMRKRISVPGVMFGVYMIFAGLERFFIEKIRVNIKYHFGSLDITQAELISVAMMLIGAFAIWYFRKNPHVKEIKQEAAAG